ncbi:PucR family transcriptional regulator [Saccharopolyspora sp. NPDC002376]
MVVDRVQQELDALAVRLGRSLTIDGTGGELIAYSAPRGDADEARISAILARHVSPEVRDWQDRHLTDEVAGPIEIPANAALGMSSRVCIPLRRNDDLLGHLWMLAEDLADSDLAALQHGATALADLLDIAARTRPGSARQDADALVRRLFDGGDASELATAVPDIVDGTIQVIVAIAAHPRDGGARPFRPSELRALTGAMTPVLRASPGYVGSYVSMSHALVLVRQPDLLDEIDQVVSRCLATGSELALGISEPLPFGRSSAETARDQAVAAAELASLDPALNRHATWSSLGAYRALIDAEPDLALSSIDSAGTSAPMLLETLETFLDLGGDVQATAARLNLHRSSLYYRLDRISKLLGAELSNGLVRLELHLALKQRRANRRTLR